LEVEENDHFDVFVQVITAKADSFQERDIASSQDIYYNLPLQIVICNLQIVICNLSSLPQEAQYLYKFSFGLVIYFVIHKTYADVLESEKLL
jgi:hypothetical protein